MPSTISYGRADRAKIRIVRFSGVLVTFLLFFLAVIINDQDASAAIWGLEQQISDDTGTEVQLWPDVAVDGDKVHVVWVDEEGMGSRDIYYRFFNGTAWEPEQQISTGFGEKSYSSLAAENGRVHVVWHLSGTGGWDIYYRMFNGTAWEPEQQISTRSVSEWQWRPSVAAENGRVHVVWEYWEDSGVGDADVYYRFFNGTAWEPEQQISQFSGPKYQGEPSVAAHGDTVHVTWQDRRDGDQDIYYRYFNGTAWEPEQEISSDVMAEWQWSPDIAVEGDTVHVVWRDEGDGDGDIYYRFFNGTAWEPEKQISTDVAQEWQGVGSVAVNGGRVHVVWEDRGDGDGDIYYRFFNGTAWHPIEPVSIGAGSEREGNPSVAVAGDRVHVVWEDQGDGDKDIFYRIGKIEYFGRPESRAFQISPYWQTTSTFHIDWNATDSYALSHISLFYRYSQDNSSWLDWAEWYNGQISGTSASGSILFAAPHGDGYYEFYTIASNEAGNSETVPLSADSMAGVDTKPPLGSIIINHGNAWTTSTSVVFSLEYEDNLSGVFQVQYSNDGAWDEEEWEFPSSMKSWTLTETDGVKTVYYRIGDNAGLVSVYSDDIELDTKPPTIESISPPDGATGSEVTTHIEVTFSERMNRPATTSSFSLMKDTIEVGGTVSWATDERTMSFIPTKDLEYNTTYQIIITTWAKDIAGNSLVTVSETIFTTKEVGEEPGEEPLVATDYWWIVIVLIVVTLIVVFIAWRKRKKQPSEEKDSAREGTTSEATQSRRLGVEENADSEEGLE